MKLQNNRKFFTLVAALILASALLLTGCIYAITSWPDTSENYNLDAMESIITGTTNSNVNITVEDAPKPQFSIRTKIDAYSSSEEVGTIRFFSREQAEELSSRRANGEYFTLSHNEIIYIINDTLTKYFSNNKIILTDATDSGFIPKERIQETEDHLITCYCGDYSEYVVGGGVYIEEANEVYQQMLNDLFDIIFYRIGMLDSTFILINIYTTDDNSEWMVADGGAPILLYGAGKYGIESINVAPSIPTAQYWMKNDIQTKGMTREEYTQTITTLLMNRSKDGLTDISTLTIANIKDLKFSKGDDRFYPIKKVDDKAPVLRKLKLLDRSREHFENLTAGLYPEYNTLTPTLTLSKSDYLFGINGDGNGLRVGMSYKELVDTFGIPFQKDFFALLGYYKTKEHWGDITVKLSPSDYSVIEVSPALPEFTLDKTTQSLILGGYDKQLNYCYYISIPETTKYESIPESAWKHLPNVTDARILAAKERLDARLKELGKKEESASFSVSENDNALWLSAEVIIGEGDDHRHIIYREIISADAPPSGE